MSESARSAVIILMTMMGGAVIGALGLASWNIALDLGIRVTGPGTHWLIPPAIGAAAGIITIPASRNLGRVQKLGGSLITSRLALTMSGTYTALMCGALWIAYWLTARDGQGLGGHPAALRGAEIAAWALPTLVWITMFILMTAFIGQQGRKEEDR